MLLRLAEEHELVLTDIPFVGDKWSDVMAARAVGARPLLVYTGHGAVTAAQHAPDVKETFIDLAAAVTALLGEERA
jgi:D-glycero-D-manno-heptose 1,7-bisphosphate phosphatase